jgi:hypothetical protein
MNSLWRGIVAANLLAPAVMMPLRTLVKRCKRFTPLLAAPAALLLIQGEAKAILTYNIFESAGNVVVQASGSLNLAVAPNSPLNCFGVNGAIISSSALVCTGPSSPVVSRYDISGPASFDGTVFQVPADSVSGIATGLQGGTFNRVSPGFFIDPAYISGTLIVSSATYNGQTLPTLGFTTTGLIGTWTLNGTSESIQVILGAPTPPAAAVPGLLPLLGAGAAFGWSRRLRKRIATPLITPPQA